MDCFIRHRVAEKSLVEVDTYVEKLCTQRWKGIPAHCVKNSSFSSIPITGVIAFHEKAGQTNSPSA